MKCGDVCSWLRSEVITDDVTAYKRSILYCKHITQCYNRGE